MAPGDLKKSNFGPDAEANKDASIQGAPPTPAAGPAQASVPMQGVRTMKPGQALPPAVVAGKEGATAGFTPFEELLLEWSVAVVGRSWNIIADVMRFYPLTSGQLREVVKIQEQYYNIKARKGKFYHRSMRLDPTEDDGIPILGRFKPALLMNRVLPVYPQRYAVVHEYKRRVTAEEEKMTGKRKYVGTGQATEYDIREIKYKKKYDSNPLPFLTKNGQLNLSTPSGSGACTPGRRRSSFSTSVLFNPNHYSIDLTITKSSIRESGEQNANIPAGQVAPQAGERGPHKEAQGDDPQPDPVQDREGGGQCQRL